MITNKASNILEDLETLRLIYQVVCIYTYIIYIYIIYMNILEYKIYCNYYFMLL